MTRTQHTIIERKKPNTQNAIERTTHERTPANAVGTTNPNENPGANYERHDRASEKTTRATSEKDQQTKEMSERANALIERTCEHNHEERANDRMVQRTSERTRANAINDRAHSESEGGERSES